MLAPCCLPAARWAVMLRDMYSTQLNHGEKGLVLCFETKQPYDMQESCALT